MTRAPTWSVVPETRNGGMSQRDYQRLYRERRPEVVARTAKKTQARSAAALAVAKRHPDEFRRAIAREERKRGLR